MKAIATATVNPLRDKLGVKPPAVSIDWLNVLIYGEPGTGKTHLLGTAQDHASTSPLLVLDIDGGITTLRKRKDIDVIQIRSYDQMVSVYRDLFNAIDDTGKLPYGTIGIDTFSELQKLDLGNIAKTFATDNDRLDPDVPDMRAYYKGGEHMRSIVRAFRDLPCNVFFNCHASSERDNFNRLTYYPHLPGKLRHDIPGFLDIVAWLRAETDESAEGGVNRILQTQKTESVIAKDRTNALDPVEYNPTIPALWDKLKSTN